MLTFAQLAEAVHARHVRYDRDANLPTPNVYWATAQHCSGALHNAYVAGAHTAPALRKFILEAQDALGVTLRTSNSVMRLRRLKLGDLLEAPETFQSALDAARRRRESDIVQALETLPDRLAKQLGLSLDHDDLWGRLCAEVNQVQLRYA